jgi:hypothetical protein
MDIQSGTEASDSDPLGNATNKEVALPNTTTRRQNLQAPLSTVTKWRSSDTKVTGSEPKVWSSISDRHIPVLIYFSFMSTVGVILGVLFKRRLQPLRLQCRYSHPTGDSCDRLRAEGLEFDIRPTYSGTNFFLYQHCWSNFRCVI